METKRLGDLWVKELSGSDVDYIYSGDRSEFESMARLVIAGLVTEDGILVFSPSDLSEVMAAPAWKLRDLSDAVAANSGFLSDLDDETVEGN